MLSDEEDAEGPDLRGFLGPKTADRGRSQPESSSLRLNKGKLVDPWKGSSPTREVFHHPRRVHHLGGRSPSPVKIRSWMPTDVDEDDVDYNDRFDACRLVDKRDIRDEDARLEYYGGYRLGNERDLRLSERRMTSAGLGSGRLIQGSGSAMSRVHTSGILPYCSDCGRAPSLPNDAEFGECFDESSRYGDRCCESGLSSMEVYEDREGRVIYRNDAHAAPSDSHHRKLSCCSHLHENISRPSIVRTRKKFVTSHAVEEPFTFVDDCSNRGKHIKPRYTDPGNERMIRDCDMSESDIPISHQNTHGNFRDDYTDKGIVKRPKLYYEFDGQLPNKLPRVVNPQVVMHHGHHLFVNRTSKNMVLHDPMDVKDHTVDDIHHSHASLHGIPVPKHTKKISGCGCAHLAHGTRLSPHSYTKRKLHLQQDCHSSHLSPEYNYEESSDPVDSRDIYFHPVMTEYEAKMCRAAARVQTMEDEEELDERIGEPVNEIHERKYIVSPDYTECNHRYPITGKRKIVDYKDIDNSEDMMHGEDLTDLYSYQDQQIERLAYSKQKYRQNEGEHPIRILKNYHITLKSSDKFRPSRHNEHRFSQKKAYHKVRDIEKGYDNSCKNWVEKHKEVVCDAEFSVEPDAPEGSKEYETLVHESFLKYSRDVNLNPWVQKRYRAQGKLGTLFCVVCGKSSSKEFQDTQGLAKHCLMSRRIGLKAQHFGLHKAICVLLGWGITTMDPFNWAATVLPQEEAQAAREDLILWPPIVVIHNISMMIDHPKEQKVISVNDVGSFLRGKGFAKLTVCIGKPADQSVILAKFMGTFSGLENAGRVHEYFAVNKRSRQEFTRLASRGGDGCSQTATSQASPGDEIEETILYGYMGVADDMDRLDSGTKKRVTLKSRREILDFANCPVKADG